MNNKGFMMAEVVVVSSIILIALVSLYASYSKIFTIYNQRIDYYDVTTLYELGNYRKDNLTTIKVANSLDKLLDNAGKKIYYVNASSSAVLTLTTKVSNQTFKDYLEYLSTSIDFNSLNNSRVDNLLVMENCLNNDVDNCKYAYLEVFNETS